ncbi:MAG: hypothetical protein WCF23_10650 [Candidatus Nitrosopolaris sp.]
MNCEICLWTFEIESESDTHHYLEHMIIRHETAPKIESTITLQLLNDRKKNYQEDKSKHNDDYSSKAFILNMEKTRVIDAKILIITQIHETPGIRYMELLRLTGLSNRALEYHLGILEKSDRIKVDSGR